MIQPSASDRLAGGEAAVHAVARLTRRGASISDSPEDVALARAAFERGHAVYLSQLLDPDLLAFVQRRIEVDGFKPRVHDGLPSRPNDLVLKPSVASSLLLLVVNNEPFLEFARTVTGRQDIRSFFGTVHRRVPVQVTDAPGTATSSTAGSPH